MGMTIRDIAREAGVSTATVSRALRGLPNVDPVTRAQVHAVAERLDYVVSPGRVPAGERPRRQHRGHHALRRALVLRDRAQRRRAGAAALRPRPAAVSSIGDPSETHRVPPHRRLRRRVDGFLVISLDADSADVREIFELDLPVTLIGSDARGLSSVVDRRRRRRPDGHAAPHQPRARADRAHLRPAAAQPVHAGARPLPAATSRRWATPASPVEPGPRDPGLLHRRGRRDGDDQPAGAARPADGGLRDLRRDGLRRAAGAARATASSPAATCPIVGFDGHDMSDLLDLTTVVQPVEELGAAGRPGAAREPSSTPGAGPSRSSSAPSWSSVGRRPARGSAGPS